jgi:hypothetical protein
MTSLLTQLFNIDMLILLTNYLVDDNQLLNCNKYLLNLKLKYFKFNKKYSLNELEYSFI